MANNTDWEKELYGSNNAWDNKSSSQSGGQGLLQKGSDLLRSLGLGALPTIAGGVYEAGRAGASALGDKNAYINQQTGQTVQDPFMSEQQLSQFSNPQSAIKQTGLNTLGLASWGIPETKALKAGEGASLVSKLLGGVVNRGIQGGIQGGLGNVATGGNLQSGIATGAITNPAITAGGRALTDILPRYIGFRNFGPAGLNLPDVVKAETAAGGKTLQDVRNTIAGNVKPFAIEADGTGNAQDRISLINKIKDLALQPQWDGTRGLSDLKKTSTRAFPTQVGVLSDIQKAIQNSDSPFQAFNKISNMAYSKENTPAGDKLANFIKSAAHVAREHLIGVSDNPDITRQAMDTYAAQSAMNSSGRGIANVVKNVSLKGGGEAAGAIGMSLIPGLQGLAPLAFLDTALTNGVTGPPLAKGLTLAGQKSSDAGVADIFRRLGISGVQGIVNSQNGQNN